MSRGGDSGDYSTVNQLNQNNTPSIYHSNPSATKLQKNTKFDPRSNSMDMLTAYKGPNHGVTPLKLEEIKPKK